jgi:hypothetical protein
MLRRQLAYCSISLSRYNLRAMSTSLSPLPTPATDSTSVISPAEVAHEVTPDPTDNLSVPGPSVRAADKWVKANGPPVGVTFGARKLNEEQDVWEHNAW